MHVCVCGGGGGEGDVYSLANYIHVPVTVYEET